MGILKLYPSFSSTSLLHLSHLIYICFMRPPVPPIGRARSAPYSASNNTSIPNNDIATTKSAYIDISIFTDLFFHFGSIHNVVVHSNVHHKGNICFLLQAVYQARAILFLYLLNLASLVHYYLTFHFSFLFSFDIYIISKFL